GCRWFMKWFSCKQDSDCLAGCVCNPPHWCG
nr:Chain B, E3.6 Disulfide constrained peptide [synthetic construct]